MTLANYTPLIGKPYAFVQRLCGLDFGDITMSAPSTGADNLQQFELLAETVIRIRDRVIARLTLAERLHELEDNSQKGTIGDMLLPRHLKARLLPLKVLSRISAIKAVNAEEFMVAHLFI